VLGDRLVRGEPRYLLIIRTGELMARRNDDAEGSYEQVRRLRRGWQLWVGDGWAEVQSTVVRDDSILVTVTDGRVFRVDYLEAVLCRKPATGRLIRRPRCCRARHTARAACPEPPSIWARGWL
jgi:hypothetical protein